MKKTFTITYPINYLKGTNKTVTVVGTQEQAKRFAASYGLQHGFSQVMIREVA